MTHRFHARLDPPLLAGLRQLAAANRRSLNAELNLAVQAWIERTQPVGCANAKPEADKRVNAR